MHLFSDQEKLEQVERVIRSMKAFKLPYSERRQLELMAAIAEDIRAKEIGKAPATMVTLERLLRACEDSKTRHGYGENELIDLANHIIGVWPELRLALQGSAENEDSRLPGQK